MAFLSRIQKFKEEKKADFNRQRQYKQAAYAAIKKKEDAAYYKALEKGRIKEAEKRGAARAQPLGTRLFGGEEKKRVFKKKLGKGLKNFRKKIAKNNQGGVKGPNLGTSGPVFNTPSTDHLFKVKK